MMRRGYGGVLPERRPEPAYQEYEEVLAKARAATPRFVDPARLDVYQEIARRRGGDWCTAVLGFAFPSVHSISPVESEMLAAADRMGLEPPLPAPVVRSREADAERQRLENEHRRAREEADLAKWTEAQAACAVAVEVRENVRGGGRRAFQGGGALAHVVPLADAVSGRSRSHPDGRALCETTSRATPLELGEPVKRPGTCVRCLGWMPKVRPA